MKTTLLLPLLLATSAGLCPLAASDPLDELRQTLRSAAPDGALTARVDIRSTSVNDDEGDSSAEERTATLEATLDTAGLRLSWPAAELERGRRLAAERRRNPEAPTAGGLAELDAMAAADLLDAAPGLLVTLDGATLTGSRADTWQGQPARLLDIAPAQAMSEKDRKRVKELDDTLRIWVGGDGWPLALERTTHVKAKFMLMSFVSDSATNTTYGRAGGRLYCATTRRDDSGEGMGQKGGTRATTTVTPVAP